MLYVSDLVKMTMILNKKEIIIKRADTKSKWNKPSKYTNRLQGFVSYKDGCVYICVNNEWIQNCPLDIVANV